MRTLSTVSVLAFLLFGSAAARERYFKIDKQIRRDCIFTYAGMRNKLHFGHGAALVQFKDNSPLSITCHHRGHHTCTFKPRANATYTVEKRHHRGEVHVCDSAQPVTAACQICK